MVFMFTAAEWGAIRLARDLSIPSYSGDGGPGPTHRGADANFRDLQAQLEGTENRITVARNRYITSVQQFNVTVRSFPSNLTAMAMGYKAKPNFTVENEKEISSPPKVDFGSAPSKPASGTTGAAK